MSEERILNILRPIPFDKWEEILHRENFWQMSQFIGRMSFGTFVVLLIAIALNDYQTRGIADNYWFGIIERLNQSGLPISRQEIYDCLSPYIRNERFNRAKIGRLQRFLNSELAHDLLIFNAEDFLITFETIWTLLAETMQQKKFDKTIVFSMKCLAMALMMRGRRVNTDIPIPVDLRIRNISHQLGIEGRENIQDFWKKVLEKLPDGVTVFHLDSLLWQAGDLESLLLLLSP